LGSVHVSDASRPKTIELNGKVSEISSLQHLLEEKIAVAVATRDQLHKQIDELAKEIKRIITQQNLTSYKEAVNQPRVDYNVRLIHRLSEYIDRLNKRISYFQTGVDTLVFLLQQIGDDLQLIRTLNDMPVDRLIYRINEVLDEYKPETKKHMISVEGIQWRSSEKVWNEVINKN
jgi:hypothetical protein